MRETIASPNRFLFCGKPDLVDRVSLSVAHSSPAYNIVWDDLRLFVQDNVNVVINTNVGRKIRAERYIGNENN